MKTKIKIRRKIKNKPSFIYTIPVFSVIVDKVLRNSNNINNQSRVYDGIKSSLTSNMIIIIL